MRAPSAASGGGSVGEAATSDMVRSSHDLPSVRRFPSVAGEAQGGGTSDRRASGR